MKFFFARFSSLSSVALYTAIAFTLSSCGGGSGGSPTTVSSSSSTSGSTPAAPTVLEGSVIKGPIEKAKVTAYRVDTNGLKGAVLGESYTNENGNYKLSISSYTGVVLIEAGTTNESWMNDEIQGRISIRDFTLRAVTIVDPVANPGSTAPLPQVATVSPFSDLVYSLASQVGGGKFNAPSVASAAGVVRDQLGFDPTSTKAVDATSNTSANADLTSRRYALALAGVSQMKELTTFQDQSANSCFRNAGSDQGARIKCAVSAVNSSMKVIDGAIKPQATLSDLVSATRVFEQSGKNLTKITQSDSASFSKLDEMGKAARSGSPISLKINDENAPGILSAKNLIANLRSNGDAIEIGLNANGIVQSLDNFGKSADNALTMAEDTIELVSLIDEGLKQWSQFKDGKRLDPSWRDYFGQTVPRSDYRACSLYSTAFPTGTGSNDPWQFAIGQPHLPVNAAIKALYPSDTSVLDTTALFVLAPNPASARWMGCSAYSSILTTEVDAPFTTSKEGNYDSRFRRAIRFDFGPGASSRPSQVKYEARTTKTYSQRYSNSVPSVYIKHLNLSQITKGVIDLTWDSKGSITSVSITGDMPPSVDEYGTFRTVNIPGQGQRWTYVTNGNLISERYETQLSGSFSETSNIARLDLARLKLGFIPVKGNASSTLFDLAPDGQPSFIALPTSDADCSTISKAGFNLGIAISDNNKGRAKGRLLLDSLSCGSQNNLDELQTGRLTLTGIISVLDGTGKEMELLNATITSQPANGQPSVLIDGTLSLPDRSPLRLIFSGKEIEATALSSGSESLDLKYEQGGYVIQLKSEKLVDFRGAESGGSLSMSATGNIEMNMKQGDKKVDVKHNGKTIGVLDMNAKKIQFNDGSFEFIR